MSSHNFTITFDSSFFLFQLPLAFILKWSSIVPATFLVEIYALITSSVFMNLITSDSPFIR